MNDSLLGYNLFAYCGNNPVNYVDPTGEEWIHWIIAVGVVALFAVATVVTAGGFAAAATAVGLAMLGTAAGTMATTVAAYAFLYSSMFLISAGIVAALNSSSVEKPRKLGYGGLDDRFWTIWQFCWIFHREKQYTSAIK